MIYKPVIREAAENDIPTLVEFNIAMAKETEDKTLPLEKIGPGVRYLFDHPQYGFYLVAEVDGVVVGGLMITFEWSDWRNGLFWWIQSVYVIPGFRRGGIYRAMYAEVTLRTKQHPNVCGCRLYVERSNQIAQITYQKLGMNPTHYQIFEDVFDCTDA